MRRLLAKPDGRRGIVVVLLVLLASSVGAEELTAQVYSRSVESVCTIVALRNGKPFSLGSGFVINSEGLVATNRHVVEGASNVYVKCGHRQAREGKSFVKHPTVDLAIVATGWTDTRALPIAELKPTAMIGQPIYVIGSPEGLESTISNGLISGLRREGGIEVIQISAPISHGSSGGPVLLATGEVIGIATAVSTRGQSLNFALPARLLGHVAGFGADSLADRAQPAEPPRTSERRFGEEVDQQSALAQAPNAVPTPGSAALGVKWGMTTSDVRSVYPTLREKPSRIPDLTYGYAPTTLEGASVEVVFEFFEGHLFRMTARPSDAAAAVVQGEEQLRPRRALWDAWTGRLVSQLRQKYGEPDVAPEVEDLKTPAYPMWVWRRNDGVAIVVMGTFLPEVPRLMYQVTRVTSHVDGLLKDADERQHTRERERL
jgi:hypothetical protein